MQPARDRLEILRPPYLELAPVPLDAPAIRRCPARGAALAWHVGARTPERYVAALANRPGGLALIAMLPSADELPDPTRLLRMVEEVRPAAVLPHFEAADAEDLAHVLRRPPEDPAAEVTEYLRWRGLGTDRDTTHILRRTVELSAELRSVSALSRALYLSRRALGRRFLSRGLPVPSHWLHFSRLLRVVFRLQTTQDSVLHIGYQFGYPDGFSLSNQMLRLTGVRPSEARSLLGWEWFMEAWLRMEAEAGNLTPDALVRGEPRPEPRRHLPWRQAVTAEEERSRRAG